MPDKKSRLIRLSQARELGSKKLRALRENGYDGYLVIVWLTRDGCYDIIPLERMRDTTQIVEYVR